MAMSEEFSTEAKDSIIEYYQLLNESNAKKVTQLIANALQVQAEVAQLLESMRMLRDKLEDGSK